MLGPGKYDDYVTAVREGTGAAGVILIVLDGNKGTGFCGQVAPGLLPPKLLAAILRDVAAQLEHANDHDELF